MMGSFEAGLITNILKFIVHRLRKYKLCFALLLESKNKFTHEQIHLLSLKTGRERERERERHRADCARVYGVLEK